MHPQFTDTPVSSFASPFRAPQKSEHLSLREVSVVRLIGQGLSNKHIARRLGVTPETVKSHVKNIFVKLSVRNRAEAAFRAEKMGIMV
ncbi:response regulator transcription factor [Asticcacaulis sp. SL142]|uniref:response regulator transcription factor n=1 Tax=Asticcacaulis sp. SL142 TaxID=2995155 RepID=UPI00226CC1DC|nr:response regulator transcription factor [Asticcacaulis sp. SL142]WAC46954.1 response regulator transcription factor [Asticcacaulis sp. SL142]